MKQNVLNVLLGGALLLSAPLFTSCQDILGEWDRPTPASGGSGGSSAAEGTYIVYTAPGTSSNVAIPSTATAWNFTSGNVPAGTYYVEGSFTSTGALVLQGEVNLILKDGATLTVDNGIGYTGTGSLNIFAQSNGASMGHLIVNNATPTGVSPFTEAPALKANNLTIHGGKIDATGGATADVTQFGIEVLGGKLIIYDGIISSTGNGTSNGLVADGLSSIFEVYGGDITITGGGTQAFSANLFTLGTGMKYFAADSANPESDPANVQTAPYASICPKKYAKIQKSE